MTAHNQTSPRTGRSRQSDARRTVVPIATTSASVAVTRIPPPKVAAALLVTAVLPASVTADAAKMAPPLDTLATLLSNCPCEEKTKWGGGDDG